MLQNIIYKYAILTPAQNYALKLILGVGLLFLASQIHVPLKPVPVTLQTAALLIIALCYSKKEALGTVISYVGMGAAGIPVFAAGGGLNIISGPSGGYIIGFILCIYIITSLREKFGDHNSWYLVIYSIIGLSGLYLSGIAWLATFIGLPQAIKAGLMPFILPGMVKSLFASFIVGKVKFNKKR